MFKAAAVPVSPVPGPEKAPPVTVPVTFKVPRVPRLVKEELTTLAANVVPVKDVAAAAIVAAPPKDTGVPFRVTELLVKALLGMLVSAAPEPEKEPAVTDPVTAKEPKVPRLVREELTTVAANVVPVKVPDAAVTVAEPPRGIADPFTVMALLVRALFGMLVNPVPEPEKEPAVTAPVTAREPKVPRLVKEELRTLEAKLVPVSVPAAEDTVAEAPRDIEVPFTVTELLVNAPLGMLVRDAPDPENEPAETEPDTLKELRVPKLVSDDVTTLDARVMPVRVPADAVTVAEPPNAIPVPFIVTTLLVSAALGMLVRPAPDPDTGPLKAPAVTVPVTFKEPRVPRLVREELTTLVASAVPVIPDAGDVLEETALALLAKGVKPKAPVTSEDNRETAPTRPKTEETSDVPPWITCQVVPL